MSEASATGQLLLLGCGTPTPTPRRFGSAAVLSSSSTRLLVDCGPGTTTKLVAAGLLPTDIGALVLTHLHFDHVSDVPTLVMTRWDQLADSSEPLQIVGPPGTAEFMQRLFGEHGAFAADWNARVSHLASLAVYRRRGGHKRRSAPVLNVSEISAKDDEIAIGDLVLAAGGTVHVQPYLSCNSYRVSHAGGTVGFTGDTSYSEDVATSLAGSDTLVCCCRSHQDRMAELGLNATLCGTVDAGRLADGVGARTLVLTHMGSELDSPADRSRAQRDIASVFAGQVIFAEEGMRLDLSANVVLG